MQNDPLPPQTAPSPAPVTPPQPRAPIVPVSNGALPAGEPGFLGIVGWGSLAVLAASLVAGICARRTEVSHDPQSAVTFITGAAVAIERTIEMLWTLIGNLRNTFWPLNAVAAQVDQYVADVNVSAATYRQQVADELLAVNDRVAKGEATTNEVAASASGLLDKGVAETKELQNRFDAFAQTVQGRPQIQRAQLLAAAAARDAELLNAKYKDFLPAINHAELTTNAAIDGLQDFIASFKDNPARRLISLFAGVTLGLFFVAAFHLDLFAILGVTSDSPALASIASGFVIGLGSSPTHEVIRLIQERKEGQKGQNAAQPDLPPKNS